MSPGLRRRLKYLLPPALLDAGRFLAGRLNPRWREWEAVPGGWRQGEAALRVRGWNARSAAEATANGWSDFLASVGSPHPPGGWSDGLESDGSVVPHNTALAFAYALAFAAGGRRELSVLDWGGSLGHHYQVARGLFPDLALDYHCAEVEAFCERGAALNPEVRFHSGDDWKARRYDFVMASCSLHYVEDWAQLVADLAAACSGTLFLTRVPCVLQAPSFVQIQRPYRYGFDTEYLGWCLNRDALLERCRGLGLALERELVTGEAPPILGAPEPCVYRGFLFRAAP